MFSFRYIDDTIGYDRSRQLSATDYDLWIPDSWFRVHPKPDPPGDGLLGCGREAEVDGSLF